MRSTANLNIKLRKPIRVGQWLLVKGRVVSVTAGKRDPKRKKVVIDGEIRDGLHAEANIHAQLEGLSVTGIELRADTEAETEVKVCKHRLWRSESRIITAGAFI